MSTPSPDGLKVEIDTNAGTGLTTGNYYLPVYTIV